MLAINLKVLSGAYLGGRGELRVLGSFFLFFLVEIGKILGGNQAKIGEKWILSILLRNNLGTHLANVFFPLRLGNIWRDKTNISCRREKKR